MTHGPKPKKAIDEAGRIAAERGTVLNITLTPGFFTDLLLFSGTQVVFIRVQRIRTHECDPKEIERMFKEAIHGLRNVPLSLVVCREIHVLAGLGAWQYFQVENDDIDEVLRSELPGIMAEPDRAPGKAQQAFRSAAVVPDSGVVLPGTAFPDPLPGITGK